MLFHFAPVANCSVDVGYSNSFLNGVGGKLQHELEPIEGFIGFAQDQQNIGEVI